MQGLLDAGYPSITKISVVGRGKQRGLRVGDVVYDEIPKEMLFTVVPNTDKDFVIRAILDNAKSGAEGKFGDPYDCNNLFHSSLLCWKQLIGFPFTGAYGVNLFNG